jgi:hypothetical protein
MLPRAPHMYVCICVYMYSFGLNIGCIGHLNTQLVIALNYSAIAKIHTLQVIRAHAKSFPSFSVFTRRFLVTVSNNGCSFASVLRSSLNGGSFPTAPFLHIVPYKTDFVAPIVFLITPRHGTRREHRLFSYTYPFPRECVYRAVA